MGTRFKLRVCTWNVGNAAPPSDLREWLGTETEEYDIIVIGAQEANYGAEKIQSPSPVSSPMSNNDLSESVRKPHRPLAKSSPSLSSSSEVAVSRATTSGSSDGKFRKITRAVRGAASILRVSSKNGKEKFNTNRQAARLRQNGGNKECFETFVGELAADDSSQQNSPFPPAMLCRSLPGEDEHSKFGDSSSDGNSSHPSGLDDIQADIDKIAIPFKTFEEITDSPLQSMEPKAEKDGSKPFHDDSGPSIKKMTSRNPFLLTKRAGEKDSTTEGSAPTSPCDTDEAGSPEFSLRRMLTGHRFKDGAVSNASRAGRHSATADDAGEDEAQKTPNRSKKFSQAIEQNIPSAYHLIAKYHLMEIKLLVFVHARQKRRVVRTERVAEATGLGNVVGNKGGVALKLTLDDTSFCFVCCHLAAHEGAKFLQQRNDDVVEIMRNIDRNKIHGLPVMHQYDHLFWLGDLNYRLDLKRVVPAATTWSHEQRWWHVVSLIREGRYEELMKLDELVDEMRGQRVLAGFVEGTIRFPPTFKVERGRADGCYQTGRVPSYCDRILWHSLPLHRNHVKLRDYSAVSGIDTSDHKPVYASFDLVIPKTACVYALPAPRDSLKCTIDFKSVRVFGLYEKKYETEERGLQYAVLADGALRVQSGEGVAGGGGEGERGGGERHTRRVVHADFDGGGMFIRDKAYRAEVPLKGGRVRGCGYDELPKIAVRPVGSLGDLMFKYVRIVFTRLGSRQGSSCVMSLASVVRARQGVRQTLELTKYGECVARVEVEAELVASLETWVDARNRVVRPRR